MLNLQSSTVDAKEDNELQVSANDSGSLHRTPVFPGTIPLPTLLSAA